MSYSLESKLAQLAGEDLSSCPVWVLGGGITGITTALVLQSLGLKTALLTEYVALQAHALPYSPWIATDLAMASAYPHNLRVEELLFVSDASQSVFRELNARADSGIELCQIFEVFENEPEAPPLADRRMRFQSFCGRPQTLKNSVNPPARPGAKYLWGWKFDTYFADMPRYLSFLWNLFEERGGVTRIVKLAWTELSCAAQGKLLFNCLGLGALALAQDPAQSVIMRGRQVLVKDAPRLTGDENLPVAYNYTPEAEIFSRADGTAEYVHFFSRPDGWVLGQTREPGYLDKAGHWTGATVKCAERKTEGCQVPAPILDLNESLLSSWFDENLQGKTLIGREGFRFYRAPDQDGVRLERESKDGITLVHNYGHGGSGITMSWGCALKSARLVSDRLEAPQPPWHNEPFDRLIAQLVSAPPRSTALSGRPSSDPL